MNISSAASTSACLFSGFPQNFVCFKIIEPRHSILIQLRWIYFYAQTDWYLQCVFCRWSHIFKNSSSLPLYRDNAENFLMSLCGKSGDLGYIFNREPIQRFAVASNTNKAILGTKRCNPISFQKFGPESVLVFRNNCPIAGYPLQLVDDKKLCLLMEPQFFNNFYEQPQLVGMTLELWFIGFSLSTCGALSYPPS